MSPLIVMVTLVFKSGAGTGDLLDEVLSSNPPSGFFATDF
jgi:hypothetical protein